MQWSEKVLRGAAEPIIGVGWGILWIIAEVERGPQIAIRRFCSVSPLPFHA